MKYSTVWKHNKKEYTNINIINILSDSKSSWGMVTYDIEPGH